MWEILKLQARLLADVMSSNIMFLPGLTSLSPPLIVGESALRINLQEHVWIFSEAFLADNFFYLLP